jgi:hypothetical protein
MSAALSPLEQLEQQSAPPQPNTTAQPSQQAAPSSNLSPLEQLEQQSAKPAQQAPPSGEITNDVGNTVIVPKDGESFSDTMKRAAAQGQKTTPDQINREVATMPAKAPEVLASTVGAAAAIPTIAATGGELADLAIKHLAGNVLPGMETEAAKQTLLKAIPTVKQLVGYGLSYEGLKHLFNAVSGGKK